MSRVECAFLADHPTAMPAVARWLIDEWWPDKSEQAVHELVAALGQRASRTEVPIDLVAFLDGRVAGIATIKPHELQDRFPETRHWLGGIVVDPAARGRGVAAALAEQAASAARVLGIPTLHLQTERLDGGLYARAGFEPWQQIQHDGSERLLMRRAL